MVDDSGTVTRLRSTRSRTKTRRPDDNDVREAPATRTRPYPDPKTIKAKGKAKQSKGKTNKRSRKPAAVESEDEAEAEGEEEDGDGETDEAFDEAAAVSAKDDGGHDGARSRRRTSKRLASARPADVQEEEQEEAEAEEEEEKEEPLQPTVPYPSVPIVVAPRHRDHSPIPNRPSIGSLASLADAPQGNTARPPYPYSTLIRYAIGGSDKGKLTLADLYLAVEKRFPYFKSAGGGWKNSIRHNLSLNKSFVKVPRPLTEPGKGSYWMISVGTEPPEEDPLRPSGTGPVEAYQTLEDDGAPKKRRGRAKKSTQAAADEATSPQGPPIPEVSHNGYPQYGGEYDGQRYEGQQEGAVYGAAYYPPPHHPPYPPPPPATAGPMEGVYLPEGYYPPQHSGYPAPQPFVDDRPDRSAPRTIYNHASSGSPSSAGPFGGSQALGALATSAPYGGYPGYGRYGVGGGAYTSSLGGALGNSSARDASADPMASASVRGDVSSMREEDAHASAYVDNGTAMPPPPAPSTAS